MASPYPSGFDNFPTDTADASVSATDHHNDLADAINKIQVTLGLNPEVALALTPFGSDLVTGDSQTFLTGLGDWVEVGGGTLTWEDVSFSHPLNPKAGTEGLKFVTSANGDKISLPILGTFLAGQPYVAMLLVQSTQVGIDSSWEVFFGEVGEADGVYETFDSGVWRLLTATWVPIADSSDAVVELRLNSADLPTLWVFYCKVAEKRDHLVSAGFDLSGAHGGSLFDSWGVLAAQFGGIDLKSEGSLSLSADSAIDAISTDINLLASSTMSMFDGAGLQEPNRPALETATTEGEVIAGYNLIRTMLISLGLATDGD